MLLLLTAPHKDPAAACAMLPDGHTYERSEIERWFARAARLGQPLTSPMTGEVLPSTALTSNIALRGVHRRKIRTAASRAAGRPTAAAAGHSPVFRMSA